MWIPIEEEQRDAQSPFHIVRSSCEWVADQAASVWIQEDALEQMATEIARVEIPDRDQMDPTIHLVNAPEESVAAFVVILDAVNFGSGWFPFLKKYEGKSGYETVALRLKEFCEREGIPSAIQLANLSADDCRRIFEQNAGAPIDELMDLFAAALNRLGNLLNDGYDGSPTTFIETADESASRLVEALAAMPFYQDSAEYNGREIYFLKRAQITVSDLNLALEGRGLGSFRDIDSLTMFADNVVPHVLRTDKVLGYTGDLQNRIEAGELLVSGSAEEVEIRACALTAVERIAKQLQAFGRDELTPRRLDLMLWERGRDSRYKGLARHRTRTVYY